jgi:crotonobetainyl-CoA:carnitine CoA-transferase CaiB-like acyl-CoA transferase
MSFRPLEGRLVVDVTASLAGPTCTQLLAGLGAEVVKVEPPEGDHARAWGPPFVDGAGALFMSANAGKRSLALDLSRSEDLDELLELAVRADVFVQSLRPGAAERHGFDAASLRSRKPELVYCSIGAFGASGPLRTEAGYDPLMQAASGIMSVTGAEGMPPVRVGVSLIDLSTGLWAALAIVAALGRGGGASIEVSLYETALWLLSSQIVGFLGAGDVPGRDGSAYPLIAPYQVFPTRDGDLMIVAGNDKLYRALCAVLELDDDERFRTNPDRVRNRSALVARIEERTRAWPTDDLLAALVAAGVPASPVRDVGEAVEHPQTHALGILQRLGDFTTVAQPLSVDGERVLHPSPPPALDDYRPT